MEAANNEKHRRKRNGIKGQNGRKAGGKEEKER